MDLSVITGFVFLPMLLMLGILFSIAKAFNLTFSRKTYFVGLMAGILSLVVTSVIVYNRWGHPDAPSYHKPIWDAFLGPLLGMLVAVLGLGQLLKLNFSRQAFLGGYASGLASTLTTIGLFYWYFTG